MQQKLGPKNSPILLQKKGNYSTQTNTNIIYGKKKEGVKVGKPSGAN